MSSHFVSMAAAVIVCWFAGRACRNNCKWNT